MSDELWRKLTVKSHLHHQLDQCRENATRFASEASVALAESFAPIAFTTSTTLVRFVTTSCRNYNCGEGCIRERTNVGQASNTRVAALIGVAFVLKDLKLVLRTLDSSSSE
jgi:hypothetical protein